MDEYQGFVLLPLTVKDQKINPVGCLLMIFESDPNLVTGEKRTLRYEVQGSHIDFNALVVNCSSEHQEDGTCIIKYLFEIEDRSSALQIAKIVKDQNPGMFEEDNLV